MWRLTSCFYRDQQEENLDFLSSSFRFWINAKVDYNAVL